jgi:hypothetical protein
MMWSLLGALLAGVACWIGATYGAKRELVALADEAWHLCDQLERQIEQADDLLARLRQ